MPYNYCKGDAKETAMSTIGDFKMKRISPLKIKVAFEDPSSLALIRHLKIFKFFGGSFQVIRIGSFSRISLLSLSYVVLVSFINVVLGINAILNFKFNGHFSPLLFLVIKFMSISAGPFAIVVMYLNRFESEQFLEKLIIVQKVLGITQYKMFASIKVMTALLITATAPVVYIIGLKMEIIFLIYGGILASSAMCRVFHFTYLISCLSACFDELIRTGLVVVDDVSVRRYIRIYSHLIEISSKLNHCFGTIASFMFLVPAVDFVTAATRFWAVETLTPLHAYKMLTPPILAHIGIFHVIAICQSAYDKARDCNNFLFSRVIRRKDGRSHGVSPEFQTTLLMHMGSETTVRFEIFRSLQINYNLVLSILAAYVTYILMMYQLDHTTQDVDRKTAVWPSQVDTNWFARNVTTNTTVDIIS